MPTPVYRLSSWAERSKLIERSMDIGQWQKFGLEKKKLFLYMHTYIERCLPKQVIQRCRKMCAVECFVRRIRHVLPIHQHTEPGRRLLLGWIQLTIALVAFANSTSPRPCLSFNAKQGQKSRRKKKNSSQVRLKSFKGK